MADFHPYSEWLGLPADLVEPNHYQLLGLPEFEADAARIAVAADKAMNRVRSFRPGPNAKAWSKLLDELLLAKGRLLDPERKHEYDAELREAGATTKPAAAPDSTAAPAAASSAGWDPRFPPGMGPNAGKSPPAHEPSATQTPAPAQVPEPMRAPEPVGSPTAPPTMPASAPAPAVAPVAPIAAPLAMPAMPATAWPASMLHPVAHGAPGQPTPLAPQQPAPGHPAPQTFAQPALAQPMYGAPQLPGYPQPAYPQQPAGYPQPQAYLPQQPYPQPGYAVPQQYAAPAYQPAPLANPYGAPQYPGAYAPQPMAPQPPAPPVALPDDPLGNSSYYNFGQYQTPLAHSSYEAAPSIPLDPMAPVAMPTALPQDDKQARVVGFAGGSAIPRGKAVAPAKEPAASQTHPPVGQHQAPASAQPAGSPSAHAPRTPAANPAATAPAISPTTPAMVAPALAANSVESAIAAARLEQEKGDKTLFYVSGGAIVLLLCAGIFAIANMSQPEPEVAHNPSTNIPAEPPAAKPVTPVAPKPSVRKPADPKPVDPLPVSPKPPKPSAPKPPEEMPAETTVPKPTPMETKPVEPVVDPFASPPEKPMPEKPLPAKPPEKPPEPMIPVPPPMPTPPKPPEPAPEVKLTPAELAALSQAMNAAKTALQERNFEETDKHLAAAKKLAKSEDQLAKLNRLDVLTQYVKQFDRSLKTLMADENFDAGAELTLGKSTRVVVVERSPTMIVIRINGQNRSYTLANMPDGLAMALIDLRLPTTDPVSKVIKGAYLAAAKVPTEENQNKAKELWAEAVQAGVSEVADLPLVLTDTYDFKE